MFLGDNSVFTAVGYANTLPDALDQSNYSQSSGGYIYIGTLNNGNWRIVKLYTPDNNNFTFLYPNGDEGLNYQWANRASYTYSQRIN